MSDLLCEVRFVEDDTRQSPGRLTGTLLTYGERGRNLAERFTRGALKWPAGGVVVNEQHVRGQPVVRVTPFLDGNEVRIDAMLPNTQRGRDPAVNVREGVYTGLSIEFLRATVRSRIVGGVREVHHADLDAIGKDCPMRYT